MRGGQLVDLSAQNMIDCLSGWDGCHENLGPWYGLAAVKDAGGIQNDSSYPYQAARSDSCRFDKSKSVLSITGSTQLPANDEEAMKRVVAFFGPVGVSLFSFNPPFIHYKSGVHYDPNCPSSPLAASWHSALVVGYGTDAEGRDFWIVVSLGSSSTTLRQIAWGRQLISIISPQPEKLVGRQVGRQRIHSDGPQP